MTARKRKDEEKWMVARRRRRKSRHFCIFFAARERRVLFDHRKKGFARDPQHDLLFRTHFSHSYCGTRDFDVEIGIKNITDIVFLRKVRERNLSMTRLSLEQKA